MKDVIKETLAFQDLTPEEKEKRGILARLYGPCADFINPTRNGRGYSDDLWEKVFQQPLVQEKLRNGGIFGELDHPEDREQICSEKIAICMPEAPKRDEDGHLIAYFDILDTPCGRIAYQLAKYGYKLGVSSRGTGDVITDEEGNEVVDPDTYDFECFDLVLTPSVEAARMTMQEGLSKDTLKTALCESLNKSNADERRVMEETLQHLNIDINASDGIENKPVNTETSETINEELVEANDDGSMEMIKSLQEAIKENAQLKENVKSLQESLAVSDAKVIELKEEVEKFKSTTIRLSNVAHSSKELTLKVSQLEESIEAKNRTIKRLEERNSRLVSRLNESKKDTEVNTIKLNENLSTKDSKINELTESIASYDKQVSELKESIQQVKDESTKMVEDLKTKLTKSNNIIESYKNLATSVVDRYIESKATVLGVSTNEIKNRLNSKYTLNDVDRICEELQDNALNMSKLHFNLGNNKVKVQVTESNDALTQHIKKKQEEFDDDDIDEGLLAMANIKK